MAYDPDKDKELAVLGLLDDEAENPMVVRIMAWDNGPAKLAVGIRRTKRGTDETFVQGVKRFDKDTVTRLLSVLGVPDGEKYANQAFAQAERAQRSAKKKSAKAKSKKRKKKGKEGDIIKPKVKKARK